jgi:DNA repair protein RadC
MNVDKIPLSNGGKRERKLKDSYFDGYEYRGLRVKTKLTIEGRREYKPLRLSNPKEVYNAFKKLRESDREKFYSVLLDAKNKVMGVDLVSQGSTDSAPVHPREAYKAALLASAPCVIFVHAHPSGEPEPSMADRGITALLKKTGELLGIEVLDHVIIGRDGYYSFSDKQEL